MKTRKFTLKHLELKITCLFILVLLALNCIGDLKIVSGPSMEPAFYGGDLILASKDAPAEKLERGVVVIAEIESQKPGKPFPVIKRIAGMPGDAVQVRGGCLYVNGEKQEGIKEIKNAGIAVDTVFLGPDEYFLLGDNLDDSLDSREFGPVKKKNIKSIFLHKIL